MSIYKKEILNSGVPSGSDNVELTNETDFELIPVVCPDDVYYSCTKPLGLDVVSQEIFDVLNLVAVSPTDFSQGQYGNCWELSVLIGLLDKSMGVNILQKSFDSPQGFTWAFNRPSNNVIEKTFFDTRQALMTFRFKHEGKFLESKLLDENSDYLYFYIVLGLLKAMESFTKHNKVLKNGDDKFLSQDVFQVSNGFYSIAVCYYWFKNISSELGRMYFNDSSEGYFRLLEKGKIEYDDLHNYDYRLLELLKLLEMLEDNPDKLILTVSFNSCFKAKDALFYGTNTFVNKHSYYLKACNYEKDVITLINPHNPGVQVNLTFLGFISKVLSLAYVIFPDDYLNQKPGSFARNTPITKLRKIQTINGVANAPDMLQSWVDFDPAMILRVDGNDFNIILNEGEYKLFDLRNNSIIEPEKAPDGSLKNLPFSQVLDSDYEPFEANSFMLPGVRSNYLNFSKLLVSKGYLFLDFALPVECIYKRVSTPMVNNPFLFTYCYKSKLNPKFFRYFTNFESGDFCVYETSENFKYFFVFVVNEVEYKFNRNLFEIEQFFNLETKTLAPLKVFDDRKNKGVQVNFIHKSYNEVYVSFAFRNIITQFFD